jgi:hypothetical protein
MDLSGRLQEALSRAVADEHAVASRLIFSCLSDAPPRSLPELSVIVRSSLDAARHARVLVALA